MNYDSWISCIYQLSLLKSAQIIIMNSWKENINSREVCLHLRNECKQLYSKKLENLIQLECYTKLGISIKLLIEKTGNFLQQTPIELIYFLYKEKISVLNQELLNNSDIMLIKSVFNTSFNEEDILIF